MDTIANLKESTAAQTPLLLFDVELEDSSTEHWCTHGVTVDGQSYDARVLRHNFFEIQASSAGGIDSVPRISLTLANADSRFSQLESNVGLKGARLTATFLFYDLDAQGPATEAQVVFQGLLNPPDEITEEALRVTAVNRMSLQRVLLPPFRIQRRCPWTFPATASERAEAVDGGSDGRYSRFYPCGYSAGEIGGRGNLNGGSPFTSCALTRSDCIERGMFSQDSGSNTTRRFGGCEFVPASILVRGHGSSRAEPAAVSVNEARYNDFVPLAYGTVWIEPPVVFARNDGNLSRIEVLLSSGKVESVRKVVVNNIEIPIGVSGLDMTASGWWNLFADGGRAGGFNLNFTDANGNPLGDPYGSVAALSVVVPNQIHNGSTLPRVRVLLEGAQVERFDPAGTSLGFAFSNNPSWILMDVLRRSGWRLSELDAASFAAAAAVCDETIAATDNQGNPISIRRFECNLLVRDRQTAADVIRTVRTSARLQLTYQPDGRLGVYVENSLLLQQPSKPAGSNAPAPVNGGWPAYVYADGSASGVSSGLLRLLNGAPSIRMWSRPIADTPNRYSVEFADQFNEYQRDSLAVTDFQDVSRTGQEITGRIAADGVASFDQAARLLKFFLDRSLQGNRYIEFETTVKAVGQRVGDLITVTYLKEGLNDQPFRILKIEPGANYRTVRITAQIHDDAWYNDTNGQLTLAPPTERSSTTEPTVPASLYGDELDADGEPQFGIQESQVGAADGSIMSEITVSFRPPQAGRSLAVGTPTIGLQPTISLTGGSLEGDATLYYAVTAVDSDGLEGDPSFVVRAELPPGTSTNTVQLNGLRFHRNSASFNVYRGPLPSKLFRIAAGQPISSGFLDTGLTADLDGAPDPNYDHANFYWRMEDTDEEFADVSGADNVGSSNLAMANDEFVGRSVKILRGKGAGQERKIVSNDATTFWVESPWTIEPDASSVFVAVDNTWRFGGRARTSPARFQIPNLRDRVVQVTGRSANAQNIESLEGLAIVTRWRIGGGGLGVADTGVPPEPSFGVSAPGDGSLLIAAVGFPTLQNTQTISGGLVRVHYRDERVAGPDTTLGSAASSTDTVLSFTSATSAVAGDVIQIGSELMLTDSVDPSGQQATVIRGHAGSTPIAHTPGDSVYPLDVRTETLTFRRNFFGTAESGDWAHSVWVPSIRVGAVEMQLENAFGLSPTAVAGFSELADNGVRTLFGGQFNLQVEGTLGVVNDAAPLLVVQNDLSVRDVFARVKIPPVGADVVVEVRADGVLLATLTISDGASSSASVNGAELPPLSQESSLSLDLVGVGTTFPGADLTVTLRV